MAHSVHSGIATKGHIGGGLGEAGEIAQRVARSNLIMILSAIIAVLAAVALGLTVIFGRLQRELARSRDWSETEFAALSLSRLMDPAEQQYLQDRLSPPMFRQLQRRRMLLAWRYA